MDVAREVLTEFAAFLKDRNCVVIQTEDEEGRGHNGMDIDELIEEFLTPPLLVTSITPADLPPGEHQVVITGVSFEGNKLRMHMRVADAANRR